MRFLLSLIFEYYKKSKPANNFEIILFVTKYVVIPIIVCGIYYFVIKDRLIGDIRNGFNIAWQNIIAIITIISGFLFAATSTVVSIREIDEEKIKSLARGNKTVEKMRKQLELIRDIIFMKSIVSLLLVMITCAFIILSALIENLFIYFLTIIIISITFLLMLNLIGLLVFYWSTTSLKKMNIIASSKQE